MTIRRPDMTPRLRRRITRIQHTLWVDASRFDIRCPLPLQLYKHRQRVRLPRAFLVPDAVTLS